MPETETPTGPVRVKDSETGDEYTVAAPYKESQKVIDKPAVGANGRHLPAKPSISKSTTGRKTTTTEESK